MVAHLAYTYNGFLPNKQALKKAKFLYGLGHDIASVWKKTFWNVKQSWRSNIKNTWRNPGLQLLFL